MDFRIISNEDPYYFHGTGFGKNSFHCKWTVKNTLRVYHGIICNSWISLSSSIITSRPLLRCLIVKMLDAVRTLLHQRQGIHLEYRWNGKISKTFLAEFRETSRQCFNSCSYIFVPFRVHRPTGRIKLG